MNEHKKPRGHKAHNDKDSILADAKNLLYILYPAIQRTHLTRIEAGKYAVTLETIQAIAEALDMTVDIIDERLRDLAPLRVLTE